MSRLSRDPSIVLDAANKFVADEAAMQALRLGSQGPISDSPGTGANSSDNLASRVTKETTGLRKTEIFVDVDGFDSEAADNDIIGDTTSASAYIAKITAAESGTIIGGSVECFEAPTGGEVDLDLYAHSTGTLSAGANGTGDTALLQSSGDWTLGLKQILTGVPAANDFLYLTVGTASGPTAGTYTAGKFLITLYGV